MDVVADLIHRALQSVGDDTKLKSVADDVVSLCQRFPLGMI
jgi:glycine/serine hydroxymethyltransferase